jgi:hypothetical protein
MTGSLRSTRYLVVSAGCDNPQADVAAWGVTGEGCQDIVAILPQEAIAQSVRLRSRVSEDNSPGQSGGHYESDVDVELAADDGQIIADCFECMP